MKKLHLILLFFITFNAHSQQLSFQELLSSSKSTNTFERTMFSQGNTPINISDYVAWGYATKNSNGSSTIPLTNDKTLESSGSLMPHQFDFTFAPMCVISSVFVYFYNYNDEIYPLLSLLA
jgi:hypothetical protein